MNLNRQLINLNRQLNLLNDDLYDHENLHKHLNTLFENPENVNTYHDGLENNSYVNTKTSVSIEALCNLQVESYQQAGTTVKQFVFTITDDNPNDRRLHVEIVIAGDYFNGIYCYTRKNDKHLTNDEIIICFKYCFGFYN